jgi:D-glycero-alpha-D-manno-heptose 1-phosphate guanylyltransferase
MTAGWAHSATAILLAGGKGTRIASVRPDVPKPLIEVAQRPFIEWVIEQLASAGVRRFAVSIGHLADVAERHFDRRRPHYESRGLSIETIREEAPLGTGGATAFAWDHVAARGKQGPVVVANADSLVLADVAPLLARMGEPGAPPAGLMAVGVDDAGRFGSLDVDEPHSRLVAFREKDPASTGAGWINAGVYTFQPEARTAFPGAPGATPVASSIERDVFPTLIARGVFVHTVRAPFIDIGTPESLAGADEWLHEHLGAGTGSGERA